jgi:hypothetical protein
MTWTSVSALAVITFLFAFGNFISNKTKAYISSLIPAVIIFIVLMYSGIIPADICTTSGLTGMLNAFVIPLCVVDVGTKLSIKKILPEWKSFATVLAASIGIIIVCFTIGILILGRQRSIAAIPPLTGALLATTVVQQAAAEAGNNAIGVFAMIVLVLQTILALPVATFALKMYFKDIRKKGIIDNNAPILADEKEEKYILPRIPKSWDSSYMIIFKMAIVAYIGAVVGNGLAAPTKNILSPTLMYVLFGLIASEIGFLERGPLEKSNSVGIIYLALFSVLMSTFSSVTLETLVSQIVPALIVIFIGLIGIAVLSAAAGKLFKVSPWLSIAIGTCCYLGYPGSQIVVEETVRGSDLTDEEKSKITKTVLPKMIIGYLSSAIISIICAGIFTPIIFS